jgi:hypothetical protein
VDSQVFERYYYTCIMFGVSDTFLQGYVDSYMPGDKDSKRSTTGYVFTIGGTTVSWISKLQISSCFMRWFEI